MGFLVGFSLAAQTPRRTKTVDLNSLKLAGSKCGTKWQEGGSQLIWVDDNRFAVSLWAAPCPDHPPFETSSKEVVVFDSSGSLQSTARRDDIISIARGPRGTIAGSVSGRLVLFDAQVRPTQTLDCPDGSQACGITLAPDHELNSDFAVCSSAKAQQVCDFYNGWPASKLSSTKVAGPGSQDPYTRLASGRFNAEWRVSADEIWSFSNGRLKRSSDGKRMSVISGEDYVGQNGGGCDGQVSAVEPRRFLAVCTGTHLYSDGMFDAIFGFSRVVLFEIPSGRIIARISGPEDVSATLSPSGKHLAVLRASRVQIYRVD
jgi:hypothetical protein